MVRFTLKRSLREESCCSLLVVNGGVALRRRSLRSTVRTTQSAFSSAARIFSASSPLVTSIFSSPLPKKRASNAGGLDEIRVNRPIFFLLERLDFAFTLNDETQCNRLHPAGGQTTPNLVPEQRRNLIAHQPIENAPGLLRIHEILVDVTRMLESFTDGTLRDLVKSDAANALRFIALLFFLFLLPVGFAQFFRQVGSDGFSFAIRIGREIDGIHPERQLLQPGDNFLFTRNHHVFGLEVIVDVDAERALG